MKRFAVAAIVLGVIASLHAGDQKPAATHSSGPLYTKDNQFIRPADYREWVFVSSGLGMSYNAAANAMPDDAPAFTNVFVNPESYKSFMQTGKWPDKTIFALEVYTSSSHGSINRQGHFQDSLMALEAEVKDESKGEDTWAYYGFGTDGRTAKMFPRTACWQCHEKNAAVEHSFAQFYPPFLEVALAKGTVKPGINIPLNATRLSKVIAEKGWPTAEHVLDETKAQDPEAEILRQPNLDMFARMSMDNDKATALAIFKYIVRDHPKSASAYSGLAEAYYAAGDKPHAVEAAEKTLALIPEDPALSDAQKKQLTEKMKKAMAELKK